MARGGGGSGSGGTKRESESQALMDLKAENKRLRMGQQAVGKNSGAKGKGKGEKKGKGKKSIDAGRGARMPKDLIGLSKDYKGKQICFGFNLEGCSGGQDCPKGAHRCMKCGSSSHGARQCKE